VLRTGLKYIAPSEQEVFLSLDLGIISNKGPLMKNIKRILNRGLIVSCQALKGEPLYGSKNMALMAIAAEIGGAVGIRANTPQDIGAIKKCVKIPIIGLYKIEYPKCDVYITPTKESAKKVALAGAEIIAIDATNRTRPKGLTAKELIDYIHNILNKYVMADISTYEEGLKAAEMGADLVATTLSGYTPYSPKMDKPDLILVKKLANKLRVPIIAEGKIKNPEDAAKAIENGAYAVVVGSAITRPQRIAAWFVEAINKTL